MRLLYITNGIDGSGGLERVLSLKTSWLAETQNYEVHVLVLNEAMHQPFFNFSSKIQFHSIAVSGNPWQYWRSYSKGLIAKVKEIQPQVIVVCDDGLKAFFTPLFLKKYAPIIYERHVSRSVFLRAKKDFKTRIIQTVQSFVINNLAKKFNCFVVLTEGNRQEWPLTNLEVIPNPLPFYPDSVATQRTKTVLAVGKQSYQKGYDLLLKSWSQLAPQFPEWQLHIYGKLDPQQGLESLATKLTITESVQFFPPSKTIAEKYNTAAVYVMSSRYEGFGMVLIEAMAHGLPCVTFDCPYGPSDIVKHEQTGYVVPNGDTEALANQLATLMNNESLREMMGIQARKEVLIYQMEPIGQRWINLFNSVVS